VNAAAPTCIVLAGGLGTRLRSVIADRPKCLAPIGSRPFLDLQVAQLLDQGVGRVVLSLGFMADQVVEAARLFRDAQRVSHVIEPEQLGTGGAVAFALDALGLEEALVANGDTFLDGDLSAMLAPLDRAAGEWFRMALVEVPDRSRFGGVASDAEGWATHFVPKGEARPGHINAGLYRLCRAALPAHRAGAYSLESNVLPALVHDRRVRVAPVAGEFTDIGVPDDYRLFCARHAR